MIDLTSTPMGVPEPEPVENLTAVTLVCRTQGCENEGLPITLEVPDDTRFAFCGACGERIMEATEANKERDA